VHSQHLAASQRRCKEKHHFHLQASYLLFETASGYSLFTVKDVDNVGLSSDAVQQSISDMARFSKIANLLAFKPFTTAVDALEQINAVSESQATDMLATFLKTNLPKASKKAKFLLGVTEPKLASSIQENTGARVLGCVVCLLFPMASQIHGAGCKDFVLLISLWVQASRAPAARWSRSLHVVCGCIFRTM
jgi:NOP5NT (NUC127) domain